MSSQLHIVVDMLGVQMDLESGRPCLSTLAILEEIANSDYAACTTFVLSSLYPKALDALTKKLNGLSRAANMRIWCGIKPQRDSDPWTWRFEVNDRIRNAFFSTLQPNAILATVAVEDLTSELYIANSWLCEDIPTVLLADYSDSTASPDALAEQTNADYDRPLPRADVAAFFASNGPQGAPSHWPSSWAARYRSLPATQKDLSSTVAAIVDCFRNSVAPAARYLSPRISVEATGIFKRRAVRILAIKLDHLGDFLLAIPAMSKLRARYPYATLDAVVGSWNADIARSLGVFDNIYCFDFFKRKSSTNASADSIELESLLARLPRYDLALDLRRQPDSRFFICRVEARLRVAYQTLNSSVDDLLDIALPMERDVAYRRTGMNETPISLQILRLVDCLPSSVNDFVSLPDLVPRAVRQAGVVAIFPRAGTEVREWSHANFRELISRLDKNPIVSAVNVFFVDSREVTDFGLPAAQKVQIHAGLAFSGLAEALSSASLCIANNSGGIHLAAYLGVPALGIYSGHETASEWGPQFNGGLSLHLSAHCSPCHLGRSEDCRQNNFCLRDILVDDVYSKAVEILSSTPSTALADDISTSKHVVRQQSYDSIVRALISEITPHLLHSDQHTLLAIAKALADNHPHYRVPPDSDTFGLDKTIGHDSSAVEWEGFSGGERHFRWTDGLRAAILFDLDFEAEVAGEASILLVFDTFRRQRVAVTFNGTEVFRGARSGRRILLNISVQNLRSGRNRLEFELPDAARPGIHDNRQLALAVRTLRVIGKGALARGVLRHRDRIRNFLMRWR